MGRGGGVQGWVDRGGGSRGLVGWWVVCSRGGGGPGGVG